MAWRPGPKIHTQFEDPEIETGGFSRYRRLRSESVRSAPNRLEMEPCARDQFCNEPELDVSKLDESKRTRKFAGSLGDRLVAYDLDLFADYFGSNKASLQAPKGVQRAEVTSTSPERLSQSARGEPLLATQRSLQSLDERTQQSR